MQTGSISPNMPTTIKITNARDGAQSRLPQRKSNAISPEQGLYSGGKSLFLSGSERCTARPHTASNFVMPFILLYPWHLGGNGAMAFFYITSYHMEVVISLGRAKHGVCWRKSFPLVYLIRSQMSRSWNRIL